MSLSLWAHNNQCAVAIVEELLGHSLDILKSDARVRRIIIDELKQVAKKYGEDRRTGLVEEFSQDMVQYNNFFVEKQNDKATAVAETVNDSYIKANGDERGTASYGEVCDFLVNWHIQTVVLPSITVEQSQFDPYDENQIDLSGIVNAR